MRTILTDRFVKSATAGDRRSPIFMDDDVIGFGINERINGLIYPSTSCRLSATPMRCSQSSCDLRGAKSRPWW